MATMVMSAKARAATKHSQGIGGRHCSCCEVPPGRDTTARRRAAKRSGKHAWKTAVARGEA